MSFCSTQLPTQSKLPVHGSQTSCVDLPPCVRYILEHPNDLLRELVGCTIAGIPGADQISDFAIDIADGWHNRRSQRGLREAVDYFLRHHRADVPRLMLTEAADLFAASRQQSGLSAHYVSQCRKTVSGDGRFKSCGLLR